jgi:hypothetical protein
MAFVTDGSVHYTGISNEKHMLYVMQSLGLVGKDAKRKGGTQSKADFVDGDRKFSVKHKDRLSKGSFDWVNTSRIGYIKSTHFDEFLEGVREVVESGKKVTPKVIASVRRYFQKATSEALCACTSKDIERFLRENFEQPNKGMRCVVTESGTKKLFVFKFEQHPAINFLNKGWEPFFSSRAASSAKISFRKGEQVVDSGLRLRLASNNGIQAFLGLKRDRNGHKKQSVVVAKLQQDAVHKLIDRVSHKVYSY